MKLNHPLTGSSTLAQFFPARIMQHTDTHGSIIVQPAVRGGAAPHEDGGRWHASKPCTSIPAFLRNKPISHWDPPPRSRSPLRLRPRAHVQAGGGVPSPPPAGRPGYSHPHARRRERSPSRTEELKGRCRRPRLREVRPPPPDAPSPRGFRTRKPPPKSAGLPLGVLATGEYGLLRVAMQDRLH